MLPQRPNFDLFEMTLEVAQQPHSKVLWKKWVETLQQSPMEMLIQGGIFKISVDSRWKKENDVTQVTTHPLMVMMSTWPTDLVARGLKVLLSTHEVGKNPNLGPHIEWVFASSNLSLQKIEDESDNPSLKVWSKLNDWTRTLRNHENTLQREDLGFWTFALIRAKVMHSRMRYPHLFQETPESEDQPSFEANTRAIYRCLFDHDISIAGLHRLYAGKLDFMKKNTYRDNGEDAILFYELQWMVEESANYPEQQKELLAELTHPSIERALEHSPDQARWNPMIEQLRLQVSIPKASSQAKSQARI